MRLWYRAGDISALREISRDRVVCLDVETTGLDPRSGEVLQIALVRGDGEVLLSQYVRPERHSSWPLAQRTHGISPSMVEDSPTLALLKPEIEEFFEGIDLIVGYNIAFDLLFLQTVGISFGNAPVFDVMREFAPVAGRWDADRQRYAWVSLAYCAKYYRVPLRAHDALGDSQATLGCFWAMIGRDSARNLPTSSRSYLDVVSRYSQTKASGRGGQDE